MRKELLEISVIVIIILSLSLLLCIAGESLLPSVEVRELARFYLIFTYSPLETFTVNSPEAVTAIVWDFRGLDTLYETMVFYLALIGGLALARGMGPLSRFAGAQGLSVIVKTVTRITAPMIIAVGASIALHGHLTPGGGFQGGATIAVVPMIMIVIFSLAFLAERGITKEKMLGIRSAGLIGIGITAISVFVMGLALGASAYVFQNMPKPDSPVGMPSRIGGTLISGTLWFFNFFEMLAVAAGFTIAFLILAAPKSQEGGEGRG